MAENANEKLPNDKKNKDFVQFYRPFFDEIAKLGAESPMALKLFMFICKNMDGSNALCVSQKALMEILEVSSSTIKRAIKYLKDNGWICVLKSGTSNVYIINPDVAWTSYGNQKSYCKFQANVFLSATENAEYLKNPKASNHFKTIDTDFINSMQAKKEEHEKQHLELNNNDMAATGSEG